MKRTIAGIVAATAVALVLAPAPVARAADAALTASARQTFARHQDAVVGVSGVMKVRFGGGGQAQTEEEKVEALGTFVHAPGLVVSSLSTLDPFGMVEKMFAGMGEGGESPELKVEMSDLRVRLASGTELPAKLVLKDPDLDLAFLRIEKPAKGAEAPALPTPIPLAAGVAAAPLDDVIFLGRLTSMFDRQPEVALGSIRAVVKKPRTYYLTMEVPDPGSPVFTADGKLLGIAVIHVQSGSMGGGSFSRAVGSISGRDDMPWPIVLPAGDVLEVAKQATGEGAEKPLTAK